MRAVIQRVIKASVEIEGETVGSINSGLLVFLGVAPEDKDKDLRYILDKTLNLRIFEDDQGKMNLSVQDTGGSLLIVSQFTLLGDCRKGRRPSFTASAPPDQAEALYESFVVQAKASGLRVETGRFGAMMNVTLVNDGPVTMLLDSTRLF